jgi:hypothetical protein
MIVQHLLISLLPWAIGMAAGAELGYLLARAVERLYAANLAWRKWLVFVPWRTIAVTLPLLFPLIPFWTGLGSFAGALMVGAFVFVFALPLTVIICIEQNHPSLLVGRLAALARSLATASVIIGVFAGWAGGGGLGHALSQAWLHLEYAQAAGIFWEIVAITLLVDILLGVVQSMLRSFDGQ